MVENTVDLAICTDCLVLIANGDTPPEMTEEETTAYLARIDFHWQGWHVSPGMTAESHAATGCDCEGETECWGEESFFSMGACEYCLSPLGGARHYATAWRRVILSPAFRDDAFEAYVECALWSSLGDEDEEGNCSPLDENYFAEDIDARSLKVMREELTAFLTDNAADIDDMTSGGDFGPGQCGHDFWLTRNGHGAGFWDRGLGELGERLTRAAKAWGSSDLMECGDGTLSVS